MAARWLVRPPGRPAGQVLLVCLPYAGGGPSAWRAFARALPARIEPALALPPGRERRLREPPLRRMDELVRALVEALAPELDRPFALLGHSLGALVAYELAGALLGRGATPLHVFASASRAPHLPSRAPRLHELEGEAFRRAVGELGGTPRELLAHGELWALVEQALRADLELGETYVARALEPLGVPLTAIGGERDASVRPEELSAWRAATRGTFELAWLPGDHFFLHAHARELADLVAARLRAPAGSAATLGR